jgi:hypothetical protein
MKVVDLSGYMFSGKAAVSDLLREFDCFYTPNYREEFDLLRFPHGLIDLRRSLESWSWVRSDSAIREFIKLTNILGKTPTGFYQKLFHVGFSYEQRYPGFIEHTRQFVQDITEAKWKMRWPFDTVTITPLKYAWLRLSSKLKGVHPWGEIDYHLSSGDQFDEHAKRYVMKILMCNIGSEDHTLVTNNMLEPYDPAGSFCFFDNIKSIVVDRDVRDIYVTGVTFSQGFNDMVPVYSRIIGAFDIDIFIKRQKILRAKTNNEHNDRVLRVHFEDLVADYDDTLEKVISFLEVDHKAQIRKFQYFSPDSSKVNIGLWENAPKQLQSNIKKIEDELPDLCIG